MISNLSISNFKSIKSLDLNCRRVNILIGEPNVGKSNILEALGLICGAAYGDVKRYVRFRTVSDLFFDSVVKEPLKISFTIGNKTISTSLEVQLDNNGFSGKLKEGDDIETVFTSVDFKQIHSNQLSKKLGFMRCYKYLEREDYPDPNPFFLMPPDGPNLYAILRSNPELTDIIAPMFLRYGEDLVLRETDRSIEIQRRSKNVVISHPFLSVSDTLRRMVFHLAIIKSNKDATITLEEPESHSFPFYTKQLAEMIGRDRSNQYFVTTHNPYFLESIVEKTPRKDLAVLLVRLSDHKTTMERASEKRLDGILNFEEDTFLNLRDH